MSHDVINNIDLRPSHGLFTRKLDAVGLAITYYIAMTCFYTSFSITPHSIINIVIQMIFFILFFNALPVISHFFTMKHIFICFLYIFTMFVSYIMAKDQEVFHLALITIVRGCIPIFLLGMAIRDVRKLFKYIKILAIFILLFLFTSIFIFGNSNAIAFAYSQEVGYQALIPFVIFFLILIVKKNKIAIIGILLSILLILMGGARGPLLCAMLSVLMVIMCFMKIKHNKEIVLIALLIVILGISVYFYTDILNFLMLFFEKYDISTRLIKGLLNKDIVNDNSRDTLRIFTWNEAFKNPLFGTGVINDRRLIYDNLTINTNKSVYGYYAHNILLEMLMQLGLLPGSVSFVTTIVLVLKTLSGKLIDEQRMVAVVFISVGLLPLLVSYSYVTYQYFYLLIGFSLSLNSVTRFNNLSRQSIKVLRGV